MASVQNSPVVKNLLIKDASGNTQIIEVVQTAPGKFMTASGHAIKTSTTAGGSKTIIKTSNIVNQSPQLSSNTFVLGPPAGTQQLGKPITSSITLNTPGSLIKPNQVGRQVVTIPIQPQGSVSPLIKTTGIKIEPGTQPTPGVQILETPVVQQTIQAGTQRYLVTQTPSGPQLVPAATPTSGQLVTPATAESPPSASPTLNFSKQSFISPILDHTGTRKRVDFPSDASYESKRRKSEKGGKGLRHFSMKVCEKVRTKGVTTYNEVADELVQEFAAPNQGLSSVEQQFDQKNIRRRVYDALNVLMAMNIIDKEKKEIRWLGLPTNSMQECTTLEKDRQKRIERLKSKTQQLHDLITQQVAFKCLVERNKEKERINGPPAPNGSIHLPFLIVNTAKNTVIDCSISNDKMEYLFNFDGTFEIHDDIEVLKRMGLALGLDKNECTDEQIARAKCMLPKALETYIDQIGKRAEDWRAEFPDADFEESYIGEGHIDQSENISYDASTLEISGLGGSGDLTGMSELDGIDGFDDQESNLDGAHHDDSNQDHFDDDDDDELAD